MRFIRKNGRVIPIRDDNATGGIASKAGGYGNQAALGAVMGGARHLGSRLINEGAKHADLFKVRQGVALANTARVLGLVSLGYAAKKAHDVYKEQGTVRAFTAEFVKHLASREVGSLSGGTAVGLGSVARKIKKARLSHG